jgi:hypothetical protein
LLASGIEAATVAEWSALVAAFGVVLAAIAAMLKLLVRAWAYERLIRHMEESRDGSGPPDASERAALEDARDDLQ